MPRICRGVEGGRGDSLRVDMSATEDAITRYAGWLPMLSERDLDYARARHAEVVRTLAAEPDRPRWLEIYYRWTLAAIDAENPAAALRQAVEAEDGDAEVCRALAAMDRTSCESAEWWPAHHPSPN